MNKKYTQKFREIELLLRTVLPKRDDVSVGTTTVSDGEIEVDAPALWITNASDLYELGEVIAHRDRRTKTYKYRFILNLYNAAIWYEITSVFNLVPIVESDPLFDINSCSFEIFPK